MSTVNSPRPFSCRALIVKAIMPLLKNRVWSRETTICCEASISPQVGGDGDTQLVIDKTTTQLKCLLEQLVNLVQHDDHVIQSDNDVTKRRQVSTTTILCVVYTALCYRMDHISTMGCSLMLTSLSMTHYNTSSLTHCSSPNNNTHPLPPS